MKVFKKLSGFLGFAALLLTMWSCAKEESQITTSELSTSEINNYLITGENPEGGAGPCYTIVFPVTVKLPDGTKVEVKSQEELDKLLKRGGLSTGNRNHAVLLFPYDVTLRDGSVVTVNSPKDLEKILKDCNTRVGPDTPRALCYVIVFPVTVSLPDGTKVKVESADALNKLIREWAAKGGRQKPVIDFPHDVKLKDGSVITIANSEDLKALEETCKGRKNPGGPVFKVCFEYQFPLQVKKSNGELITVNSPEELERVLKGDRTTSGKSTIVFPFVVKLRETGEILTIANEADLKALNERCRTR